MLSQWPGGAGSVYCSVQWSWRGEHGRRRPAHGWGIGLASRNRGDLEDTHSHLERATAHSSTVVDQAGAHDMGNRAAADEKGTTICCCG
eukprot:1008294-Prymnesium_polylepis.2